MPLQRMLDKADKLLRSSRVERLDSTHFNVVGDHATYSVVLRGGRVWCGCPGF